MNESQIISFPLQDENRFDNPLCCYYSKFMQYEWDEKKNLANRVKHCLDFSVAKGFCWDTAVETIDDRADYGEERWVALGLIGARVHVMIYTMRGPDMRVISLRKANRREVEYYENR